jgi:hypothetical protein
MAMSRCLTQLLFLLYMFEKILNLYFLIFYDDFNVVISKIKKNLKHSYFNIFSNKKLFIKTSYTIITFIIIYYTYKH